MTKIHVHNIEFGVLGCFSSFQKQQNSTSGSNETNIFIDKVLFTLHPIIGLIDTNTNSKEEKYISQWKHPKKGIKVSLVVSWMEKR